MNDNEFATFHDHIHRRWMLRKLCICVLPFVLIASITGACLWRASTIWIFYYDSNNEVYRLRPGAAYPSPGVSSQGIKLSWPTSGPWRANLDLDYGAEGGADYILFPIRETLRADPVLYFRYRCTGDAVRTLFQICDGSGAPLTTLDWTEQLELHGRVLQPSGKVQTATIPMTEYVGGKAANITMLFVEPGEREIDVVGIGIDRASIRDPDEEVMTSGPRRPTPAGPVRVPLGNVGAITNLGMASDPWDQLSGSQRQLLLDIERRHLQFFINRRRADDGLVPDRAPPWSTMQLAERHEVCSVGGMGFAFACWVRAERLGMLPNGTARQWAKQALRSLDTAPRQFGLLPHFILKGDTAPQSESSTIDHALLLAGLYALQSHVGPDDELDLLAEKFTNVEWDRLLIETPRGRLLSMGVGFDGTVLKAAWDDYNEGILAWVIAAGATQHPANGELFRDLATQRFPRTEPQAAAAGQHLPLFVHQYPSMFWGARPGLLLPGGIDLAENSRRATIFNRQFCGSVPDPTFDAGFYGLTACDIPRRGLAPGDPSPPERYQACAPTIGRAPGVVCPAAVVASVCFDPLQIASDLQQWQRNPELFERVLGDLGFTDSFRINEQGRIETGDDAISITVGAAALGIAELQGKGIGSLFREAPACRKGLLQCGIEVLSAGPDIHSPSD